MGNVSGLWRERQAKPLIFSMHFLPHVDNWATCDLIKVPTFKQDMPSTLSKIRTWCAATSKDAAVDSDSKPRKHFAADRFDTSMNGSMEASSEYTKSSCHSLEAAGGNSSNSLHPSRDAVSIEGLGLEAYEIIFVSYRP